MSSRPLTRSIQSIIATKHAHYRTRSFTTPSGHGFRLQWVFRPQRCALNHCCKRDRQGLEEDRQYLYGSHPSGRDVIHRRFRHHLRIRLSRLKRPRYSTLPANGVICGDPKMTKRNMKASFIEKVSTLSEQVRTLYNDGHGHSGDKYMMHVHPAKEH